VKHSSRPSVCALQALLLLLAISGCAAGVDTSPAAPLAAYGGGARLFNDEISSDPGCAPTAGPLGFDQLQGPAESLSPACAPVWTAEQLQAGFQAIRDARWLVPTAQPDFPRRIPWLSASSGCEERALAAVYYLSQLGYPEPYFLRAKVTNGAQFVLATENEPTGQVNWSAHVAAAVRVGEQLMVLDPALHVEGPITLLEWVSLFSTPEIRQVALCRDHELGDGCYDATPRGPVAPALTPSLGVTWRLEEEWRVQELLGRDPFRVLGECPPWLACPVPEPLADPTRAPSIARFATDQFVDYVYGVINIIGDNFVCGLTTVQIVGDGQAEASVPMIEACNKRRIRISPTYLPGSYQVTASNGALTSGPVVLTVTE
jgi:hypothetical protein